MLLRILIVRAVSGAAEQLEAKLQTISSAVFEQQAGLIRYHIGRRTGDEGTDEYVLTSTWPDVAALQAMTGPAWREPHIPASIARLIASARIEHYEVFAAGPASAL